MLRRTAFAALLVLPLTGCVTYQVVDRGGFYELHDGLRHVPGHAGHGDYFVHPSRPATIHAIDHWSWSSHIGWGWGSPHWGGSLGWGWGRSPHWGHPGWGGGWRHGWSHPHRHGWIGPGTVWVVPAPAPRPAVPQPMPKPRPQVIEATPALPAPVFRDGPRQFGEPRRVEDAPARFERPQRFEEPQPQIEDAPVRFERPQRFEEPRRFEELRRFERAEPGFDPMPVVVDPVE